MKPKFLIVYPNCSMGGMATVFKNRALESPDIDFELVFTRDLGGREFFDGIENVTINIVRRDRLVNYLKYAISVNHFESIFLTSFPEVFNELSRVHDKVVYEFHSSSEPVLRKEIDALDPTLIKRIYTPSIFLKDKISMMLAAELRELVCVTPNLVDGRIFNADTHPLRNFDIGEKKALIWIGRLDAGKNINDFLRVLSIVNDDYIGVVILGLEQDPKRFASFFGYASSLGVLEKVRTFVNIPQSGVAGIFAYARENNGFFISTSLGESFGYGVQEALDIGLDTVAYNVGALSERSNSLTGTNYTLVDVGDITQMARAITSL